MRASIEPINCPQTSVIRFHNFCQTFGDFLAINSLPNKVIDDQANYKKIFDIRKYSALRLLKTQKYF